MTDEPQTPGFRELGLPEPLLEALTTLGYETPSPIQARTIPLLLAGSDLVGQAQTGTGKTAAFALPVLARIDLEHKVPQALVMVPTRELAIQVAEAFQRYASHLGGFHVLPIYGGQSYTPQLKGLRRGPHVIVGTPGRIMDHMKSAALQLAGLRFIVLDEGDEMLQMGFVDDIEWILSQTPPQRQIALFSATMPPAIRRIAQKHMRAPEQVTIQNRASTAPKIRQRYWPVSGLHKLDALTRLLEAEVFDAMLIFVRTKLETADLAERLQARGFSAAALSGDVPQQQRERTIARLKSGQLDILVATDVAARGLDVERISHVINYDIPYDSETYIHRIGRTGRAGRSGEAILFVAPRERNMLRIIERATRQPIEPMHLPTVEDVNERRILKFKERIQKALENGAGKDFAPLLEQMERDGNVPALEIAAALAGLLQGEKPFLLTPKAGTTRSPGDTRDWGETGQPAASPSPEAGSKPSAHADRRPGAGTGADVSAGTHRHPEAPERSDTPHDRREKRSRKHSPPMETFRIEVGHAHGVQPGNIVGAIANEAELDGRLIGHIDIREDHSFVDLPVGMPKEIFSELQKVRVRGVELRISRVGSKPERPSPSEQPSGERKPHLHAQGPHRKSLGSSAHPRDARGGPPGRTGPGTRPRKPSAPRSHPRGPGKRRDAP